MGTVSQLRGWWRLVNRGVFARLVLPLEHSVLYKSLKQVHDEGASHHHKQQKHVGVTAEYPFQQRCNMDELMPEEDDQAATGSPSNDHCDGELRELDAEHKFVDRVTCTATLELVRAACRT